MTTSSTSSPLPPSIWSIAWPTTLANLLLASVGMVQIVLAADLGPEAASAVAVSQRVFFVLQAALFGLATGVSALVARNIGANNFDKAGQTTQSAMLLGLMVSMLMGGVCYLVAPSIVNWFELQGEARTLAINLILWVCLFNPIYSLNIVLTTTMRASGDAINPLVLAFISGLGNGLGCYALSHGSFGLPNLGAEGLAVGGVMGSIVSLLVYGTLWRLDKLNVPYPSLSNIRVKTNKLIRIALPSAIEQTLMQVGFLVYMVAIASYGNQVLAAYGLGINLLTLIIFVSLGFASSAAVIVGQYMGRGQPELAEKFGWRGWRMCLAFMVVAGLSFEIFGGHLARAVTDDVQVQYYMAVFLSIVALAMPLIATDFALGGAIRGAGETLYPLKISFYSLILVRFILPFVFLEFSLAVQWMFYLTALDFGIKAVFMTLYFRSGKWKRKEI
jgi:putative MATE family efflux protein